MTTSTRVAIDPFGDDIPAESARLRALGPVVPVELPGGIPAWAPTGYGILKSLILDRRVSKDPRRHWSKWPEIGEHPAWAWLAGRIGVADLLSTYGADHTRLRKLVAPGFTARRTEAMRPRVEAVTAELLDALPGGTPGAPVDLRAGYARPLPMRVICELLGVPDDMADAMRTLIAAVADTSGPAAERGDAVRRQIATVLPALVAYKAEHPGEDMTTDLMRARLEDGDRLGDQELLDTLLLVVAAGFETTVNLIGNAVVALLTHPGQLVAVRTGQLGWEAVVDEVLRAYSPVASLPLRFAVEDITIGGVTVPAGDAIVTTYAAANLDPEHYGPTAAEFDPGRSADDHLAFGIGVHRCIGAPLARMEAVTALPALFDRYPFMTPAADPAGLRKVPSFMACGWREIPVRLGQPRLS
jgi:cytochrome P450